MTDEQRMISQLAERKITVFVKNQTFEQHSVFTHFHSCNLNLYLKKTRLIAHTYTQRHRSKRKEKTYTKAVITHTLHTPSGNSKTNSQWLLHQHDSSACDRTLEHANTCVGVITCVTEYVCGSLNPCQRSHTSSMCFANLFFPAEDWNISRLWTAGVWGDGGAWVVTLWILKREKIKNKKWSHWSNFKKRKTKNMFPCLGTLLSDCMSTCSLCSYAG